MGFEKLDRLPLKNGGDISAYRALAMKVVKPTAEAYCEDYRYLNIDYPKKSDQLEQRIKKTDDRQKRKYLEAKLRHLQSEAWETMQDMLMCEDFILSDRFDIYMPHTEGHDFLTALQRKAEHDCFG